MVSGYVVEHGKLVGIALPVEFVEKIVALVVWEFIHLIRTYVEHFIDKLSVVFLSFIDGQENWLKLFLKLRQILKHLHRVDISHHCLVIDDDLLLVWLGEP